MFHCPVAFSYYFAYSTAFGNLVIMRFQYSSVPTAVLLLLSVYLMMVVLVECGEGWIREEDVWADKARAGEWTVTKIIEKRRSAMRFTYSISPMNNLPREWKAQLATVEIGQRT